MKKFRTIFAFFIPILSVIILFLVFGPSIQVVGQPVLASTEMRGVWVTSAYNLDFPSRRGMSPAEMRREIDDILNRAYVLGINAVFVQVRPAADALYQSDYFPWSAQITGIQGRAPQDGFDPLAYWIERAHTLGIEVHAWINPYRVTFPNENITDVRRLALGHPARENPHLTVAYGNSLFFDPGLPEVRQLIADSVAHIIHNYDIDGIHLDDYFYPSRDFPDEASFAAHGDGMNIHDWRRENINEMIKLLQSTIQELDPDVRFGVSPRAIWLNDNSDPRGSDTRGQESYHAQYADSRRWVLEGWVDYIVPQIYWYTGFEIADYERVLTWWEDLLEDTDVDLYIGLALYREVQGRPNWEGEILRQLYRNNQSEVVRGSIFFRSTHLEGALGDDIGRFFDRHIPEVTPVPTATPLFYMDHMIVAQPRRDMTVIDATGFNFFGSSIPSLPLYVNGEPVTNRTGEGFFSVFLPLERGNNIFTFTQEGQEPITRVVTNSAPVMATPTPPMAAAAVTNVIPTYDEWAMRGAIVQFAATAPAGATVTVQIGNESIQLSQVNPDLVATATNITPARFTGSFYLDIEADASDVTDLGRPIYTFEWNGITASTTAAGGITQIGIEARVYAEVTAEYAWLFPNATITGGSHWLVHYGQRDRLLAVHGEWTQLASGVWTQSTNLRRWVETEEPSPLVALAGHLSEGRYIINEDHDKIIWNTDIFPIVYADFDGDELIVSMGIQSSLPPIFYTPHSTMFDSIKIGIHNDAPAYFMTMHPDARLEGFYVEYEDGELRLILRHRRNLAEGDYPLVGFSFVLDAGHGGDDPGALGPMGAFIPEAEIVLANAHLVAQRLEMLGAEVTIIRDTAEAFYALQERVNISRTIMPDMFISIHANSTAETTNATNIHGFTMWYRNPLSLPAATHFMNSLHYINPLTTRHRTVHQANFFVTRPVWAPSVLVEISFMNNIQDFAWMINPKHQSELAWGIVNTILSYYR